MQKCLLSFVLTLTSLFFPVLLNGQLTFSGDFDGLFQHLNVRRTVQDSLKSNAFSLQGSAELSLGYVHSRWAALVSLEADFSKGTSIQNVIVPATFIFNLYELWVSYHFTKKLSIQAGRIEINYDDERFFEARDWSNLVTSHNALILHYLEPDTGLMNDVGFAANRFYGTYYLFGTNPSVNSYRYMAYWYFLKKLFDEKLTFSITNIFNADDNGINPELLYGRNTLGGSAWLSWLLWDLDLAGFYQFGRIPDGRRVNAFYLAGYFRVHPVEWLSLMPAFEHLSGDNIKDSAAWRDVVHGFSMLYGSLNNSLGQPGLFYTLRTNLHPALNNLYFKATFTLSEKVSIESMYHWITIPDHYIAEYNADSSSLTFQKYPSTMMQEGDVKVTWKPVKNLTLDLYYSLIFPGPGMRSLNGWEFNAKNPISYGYIEVEWTPVFIKRGPKARSGT